MSGEGRERPVDFAQARVNALADAIRGLVEQMKITNTHVERLNGDVARLQRDLGAFRADAVTRFDRIDEELAGVRREQIRCANQILDAQQRTGVVRR